jgi:hypothetical protein
MPGIMAANLASLHVERADDLFGGQQGLKMPQKQKIDRDKVDAALNTPCHSLRRRALDTTS